MAFTSQGNNCALLESVFAFPVFGSEAWGTRDDTLYPEEELWIAGASEKRIQEFTAVRACAREALARLGRERPPLIADSIRGPTWPAGVMGSLTHTESYRAAVVAERGEHIALGIDAEPALPLPSDIGKRILTEREIRLVKLFEDETGLGCWDRLVFSAKESVYKAWAPLVGRFLDFGEACLSLMPRTKDEGSFTAAIDDPVLPLVRGGWILADGLIRTAAWIDADTETSPLRGHTRF